MRRQCLKWCYTCRQGVNRGYFGPCSAVGAIEGINYIKTKELTSLSVQQLVDCDHAYNMGCGGGA